MNHQGVHGIVAKSDDGRHVLLRCSFDAVLRPSARSDWHLLRSRLPEDLVPADSRQRTRIRGQHQPQ